MLTRESLSALLDISRDPDFGPAIEWISISTDHLVSAEAVADPSIFVENPIWPSSLQGVSPVNGCEDYLADQEEFHRLGLDTTFLAQALQSATNCRNIIINGEDKPWGAVIVKEKTGYFPPIGTDWDEDCDHVQRAVHVVIAALAASNTQVELLGFKSELPQKTVTPTMLDLPGFCLNPTLPWIKSLKNLQMSISFELDPEKEAKALAKFVMLFPGLTYLTFKFPDIHAHDENVAALSRHLKLPSIQTLKFDGSDCHPDILLSFLHGLHPEELYLVNVDFGIEGTWQPFLARARDELNLSKFYMEECQEMSDEIWFGEGDHYIAQRMFLDTTGEDSDPSLLWNRLINGIRRSLNLWDPSGKVHLIR
ncbi:hypothetical protein N7466_004469 [Penicillium verhagenii]|uniref:uncharacterized protein n=1 Tax=Penicillium verhagenii TaxID=1562060 RepID=UPI0025455C94|nr:uncharacterized protein N7466_004469 [Penicillium verhagenii]KAJ5934922.1 hypothetical protein N7466_004469 [Penicillium verhagenii]